MKLKFLPLFFFFIAMANFSLQLEALSFIPCNDPKLNQVSKPLTKEEILSESVQRLIHEMLVLAGYEADSTQTGNSSVLVGLAAPQIGELKQIIIVNTQTKEELKKGKSKPQFDILINPVITWQSVETQCSYEGCFSVPEKYLGRPKRPQAIEIEALDQNGNKVIKRYEKDAAAVAHHEIDHLKGIRFPERLTSEKDLHILEKGSDLILYRKKYKNWSNHASEREWIDMKNKEYFSKK